MLHDIGKLVLGFFFWEWAERVQNLRKQKKCSCRQAEARMRCVRSAGVNRAGVAGGALELVPPQGCKKWPGDLSSVGVAAHHT